ncbi:hypothetical protein TVAG_112850 [Trichomonas vaginalis G3]|uniref:Uncharacterized protein n=1 Tax=Trichomonas vaginalis (strain ATCC PRA-98 / G3) TaxID=412133 RepID=A2F732_TRIV3|nr:hypothetical protein TVAGG3_0258560 [Trichomonas vaginalis G3]EAX99269.1 hypothetical protein TVAG_112850 [Trichomonas vaginalis G3]KAI5524935.1 hypothetical protein TVAGG3_0258560 [Trichomonas vaginalis G3]|eukprot:XP_001312199.1 hypothetical protein [Trichomonas vaginalis G3]
MRKGSNIYLIVFSISISALSLFVLNFQSRLNADKLDLLSDFELPKRIYANPYPPPRKSNHSIPDKDKLYIAVMDSVYEPTELLCTLYDSWIKEVQEMQFVDAVEIYSLSSYSDSNCSLRTITFADPPKQFPINRSPSCYLMYSLFKMFLARSTANWILIVSDGAYVNPKLLPKFISKYANSSYYDSPLAKGQCQELRDNFQIFAPNSGVLLTRSAVKAVFDRPRKFEISCQIELPAYETITHVLDQIDIMPIHNHDFRFLGQPFTKSKYFKWIDSGDYSKVKNCTSGYSSPRICYPRSYKIKDLVVWAGSGKKIDKIKFLLGAKRWLDLAPDNLGFMYNTYETDICIMSKD